MRCQRTDNNVCGESIVELAFEIEQRLGSQRVSVCGGKFVHDLSEADQVMRPALEDKRHLNCPPDLNIALDIYQVYLS